MAVLHFFAAVAMAIIRELYALNILDPSFTTKKDFTALRYYWALSLQISIITTKVDRKGRRSDGSVYKNFNFYSALKKHQFNQNNSHLHKVLTYFGSLLNNKSNIPIVFVAGHSSSLSTNRMKQFGFKLAPNIGKNEFGPNIGENEFAIRSDRFKLFAVKAQLIT